MKELHGDIWNFHPDNYVVISTNGYVKANGENVMGRGVAQQAAKRFPHLPGRLGKDLQEQGNHVFIYDKVRIITFPVKDVWWNKADPKLILRSVDELIERTQHITRGIVLPRVGCGNGGLDWDHMYPVLKESLGDKFSLVSYVNTTT